MKTNLVFHDKTIDIELSQSAEKQHQLLDSPLVIEIQIYFSCLISKRIAFYSAQRSNGTSQINTVELADKLRDSLKLSDNLYVRVTAIMTKSCSVKDSIGPPPVSDFLIKNQKPYVPAWLKIQYKKGQWNGQYGWNPDIQTNANTKLIMDVPSSLP